MICLLISLFPSVCVYFFSFFVAMNSYDVRCRTSAPSQTNPHLVRWKRLLLKVWTAVTPSHWAVWYDALLLIVSSSLTLWGVMQIIFLWVVISKFQWVLSFCIEIQVNAQPKVTFSTTHVKVRVGFTDG